MRVEGSRAVSVDDAQQSFRDDSPASALTVGPGWLARRLRARIHPGPAGFTADSTKREEFPSLTTLDIVLEARSANASR
jgi:hypothetical protein